MRRKSGRYFLTDTSCETCTGLKKETTIKSRYNPSQLDPKNQPIHNWFTYVQTYSPKLVEYALEKISATKGEIILDPFVGTGTTLVETKRKGIDNIGIDAIEFLAFVSKVKTEWDIKPENLDSACDEVLSSASSRIPGYLKEFNVKTINDFTSEASKNERIPERYLDLVKRKYISPKPLAKILALKDSIKGKFEEKVENGLTLALASVILPSSNLKFGPEISKIKPIDDVNVFQVFRKKVDQIVKDLKYIQKYDEFGKSIVIRKHSGGIGDSRALEKALEGHSFDHIITSPPYPQDHDYTREVRLEITLLDYVKDDEDLRSIKKNMIRSSTRSTYSNDNDWKYVRDFDDICKIVQKVDRRVKETGGTSGFEKLYPKVVAEYFGGMYRFLKDAYREMSERGTATIIVGDSHAFKMVHIQTAELLAQLGLDIGFRDYDIEPWRYIRSTAHDFLNPENILTLYK